MIGRPVSLSRFVGEAGLSSLCTFGKLFLVVLSSKCRLFGVASKFL